MFHKLVAAVAFFLLSVISIQGWSADPIIFGVQKTLPLENKEPVYQDFYINAGTEKGLKPGLVINVFRRVNLYDSFQNKSPGELQVPVGRVKVIHSQNGISVARMFSSVSRTNTPILDYDYIMVGDLLDMTSAKMDRGDDKSHKSAKNSVEYVPANNSEAQSVLEKVGQVEMASKSEATEEPAPVNQAL